MTIKDIARESGYSIGTVSRVINNAPGVSAKAKDAVMNVVSKHSFILNSNAKHLKQQSKDGIAIIIKGTHNMLFAEIVELMQVQVRKKGYACMMYYISELDNEVEEAIRICHERRPLGILFLGCNHEYFRQKFKHIAVPCVLVASDAEGLHFKNLSSVCTDDYEAAKKVIERLVELGHEKIGILSGKTKISQVSDNRYRGAVKALMEKGCVYDEKKQLVESYFTIPAGYVSMNMLLEKMPDITAVFVMSDVMAIGAIRAICDRGLRVPEDISVIGFDGVEIGQYMKPRLTTVRQQKEKIAERSIEILLDCIEKGSEAVYETEEFGQIKGESVITR